MMSRKIIYLVFSVLTALGINPAFGQAGQIKKALENSYWTFAQISSSDTCIDFTNDTITNVHFFKTGSCLNDSACEVFMGQYTLINDPVSGVLKWVYTSCNPELIFRDKISDSRYKVLHISEQGRFSAVVTLTGKRIYFVGKAENGDELKEEYIKIELPHALSEIIKH